jgi:hypothetical protein
MSTREAKRGDPPFDLIDFRNELIVHVESHRLGGTVTDHGYDVVQQTADFVAELNDGGSRYNVEIRRLQ